MSGSGFSDAQRAALASVLDAIIPPSANGRLPGAGELGLASSIEERLGAMGAFTALGLDALDALARERGVSGFAALAPAARADVLNAHAAADPGFLPGLVFQVYSAYYQHPRVQEGLGLEPRPPHPKGYALEQPDLDALLAPVRAKAKQYREV
jgi:gluconate 2-dehydrogenase subunit 3-like protein